MNKLLGTEKVALMQIYVPFGPPLSSCSRPGDIVGFGWLPRGGDQTEKCKSLSFGSENSESKKRMSNPVT